MNKKISNTFFYHYTTRENAKKILKNKTLLFSNPKWIIQKNQGKVADHLFSQHIYSHFIEEDMDINEYSINKFYKKISHDYLLKNSYIFSGTTRFDIPLHWERFAENGQGICLKIRFSDIKNDSIINEVKYDGYYFTRMECKQFINNIYYNISPSSTEIKAFLKAVTFTKYPQYSSEKEIRAATLSDTESSKTLDIPINPMAIHKIFTKCKETYLEFQDLEDYPKDKVLLINKNQ